MKRSLLFFGAVICLLFLVAPAFANNDLVVKATVPFEFWVGDQKFPAGEYVFQVDDHSKAIGINGSDKKYVMTHDQSLVTVSKDTKLVFWRDGDRYVLHQVVAGGDRHVHDIAHSIEVVDIK